MVGQSVGKALCDGARGGGGSGGVGNSAQIGGVGGSGRFVVYEYS